MLAHLVALALASAQLPQLRARPDDPLHRSAELEVGPTGVAVEYVADVSGSVSIWARSEVLDPRLVVEVVGRAGLHEDDDSGGGTTPHLELEVELGQVLVIRVAARDLAGSGPVELLALASPETDETRAAADRCERAFEESNRLRDAGNLGAARALVAETIESGLTVPGAETSERLADAAWLLGSEAHNLSLARPAQAAWSHLHRQRARTLPPDHWELQQARAHHALALDMTNDHALARTLEEQVLASRLRTLPHGHVDVAIARQNLGSTLFDLGEYPAARQLLEEALAGAAGVVPESHPLWTTARGNLARVLKAQGDVDAARALEEQTLAALTQSLPPDDLKLQAARMSYALTLRAQGDLHAARALLEQVLEVYSRRLPFDHRDLQTTRLNLGATLRMLGDLPAARALEEEVVQVMSRTLPAESRTLLRAQQNLASTRYELGDLEGARELFERVLAGYADRRSDHPDVLEMKGNLALVRKALGDVQGARALEEDLLAARERRLPGDHPDVQAARANLAGTLRSLGEHERARELFERVLATLAGKLPPDHPDLQVARLNLAAATSSLGDHGAARALLEAAVAVQSRTLPSDHPVLQVARANLAVELFELGDVEAARAQLAAVLAVQSRSLPADHPDLQLTRTNLASLLPAAGRWEEARALVETVVEAQARTLAADHPDLQRTRAVLAATLQAQGDLPAAKALLEEVLAVQERVLPAHDPDLQRTRVNLAGSAKRLGELDRALELEELALEVRSRSLPPHHDDLQTVRNNLAWTLLARSLRAAHAGGERSAADEERAIELLRAAARAQASAAREVRLSAPSREAEEVCATLALHVRSTLSVALGLGDIGPRRELAHDAFALSEATRNGGLSAGDSARLAAASPEYGRARDRLRQASSELARLARAGAGTARFDEAWSEREAAERALVELGRQLSGATTTAVDAAVVADALGADRAAVAFRSFERSMLAFPEPPDGSAAVLPSESRRPSLCAFVVRPAARAGEDGDVLALVDLGPLEPIERAVADWRAAISVELERGMSVDADPAQVVRSRGEVLRALVLDPLLPHLGDRERVVIVLDDVLHLVPLDALPLGESADQLVGDRWRFETRATLAELLDSKPEPKGELLLALGGAAFNSEPVDPSEQELAAAQDDVVAEAVRPGAVASILRGGAWEPGFPPLTHSRDEVRGIGALSEEIFGDARPVRVLERREASRAALEQLAPRARFLHVATHGWFASESIRSWSDPRPIDEQLGLGVRLTGEEQVRGMSPMLLCGLALAGANLPEDAVGRAPGLITAEELAALDLSSCELAVLSACDTNVGERRGGQGVASLQRALQMAGARSVITSLWKVPDEATKDLMLDFYRRIWVEKKPKAEALWEAKTRLREATDERGEPIYGPRDWAAWVLTGAQD